MIPDLTYLERAQWGKGCFAEDYLLLAGIVAQIKPRTILEIGTSTGLGAVVLADAACHWYEYAQVTTIDVDQSHGWDNLFLKPGIERYIEFVQGASDEVLAGYLVADRSFDLAFIDGDHSYEQAARDWEYVRRLASVIVFHDTTQFQGLQRLIAEIRLGWPKYDLFQFVSAPGHRVKPQWQREGFITGMTLVQKPEIREVLSEQAHRDRQGRLLPGHPERQVPGLRLAFP